MIENEDDIPDMIYDCIKRDIKLTAWERDFIADLDCLDYTRLTDKQKDKLEAIWDRVTS